MKTIIRSANHHPEVNSINQIFENLLANSNWQWPQSDQRFLPIDVLELDNHLVVKAAVPGVDPSQLDITLEDNILTIKGETTNEHENSNAKVYHQEYRYGSFTRSVRLPEGLNLEGVRADFNNGMVTISIPKLEEPKPKQIKIAISSTAQASTEVNATQGEGSAQNN